MLCEYILQNKKGRHAGRFSLGTSPLGKKQDLHGGREAVSGGDKRLKEQPHAQRLRSPIQVLVHRIPKKKNHWKGESGV